MRLPLPIVALVLLLLSAAVAGAGLHATARAETASSITTANFRIGDLLAYESVAEVAPASGAPRSLNWSARIEIGEPGERADRFGLPRLTDTVHVEGFLADGASLQLTCHVLAGGTEAVVREGPQRTRSLNVSEQQLRDPLGVAAYDASTERTATLVASYDPRPCPTGYLPLDARFEEGARVRFDRFVPVDPLLVHLGLDASTTASGVATLFEGRPALAFQFTWSTASGRLAHGDATVVVAEGIPGIASLAYDLRIGGDGPTQGETTNAWRMLCRLFDETACAAAEAGIEAPVAVPLQLRFTRTLTGYAPIPYGEHVAPPRNLALPPVDPRAERVPFDREAPPSDGLRLRYPFREAVAALKEDPTTGLSEFLAKFPDAVLIEARYDRRGSAEQDALETDGEWVIVHAEGGSRHIARTERFAAATTPAGTLPLAKKPVIQSGETVLEAWGGWESPLPAELAAPEALLGRSEDDFDSDAVEAFVYELALVEGSDAPAPRYLVSNISLARPRAGPSWDGLQHRFDAVTGALLESERVLVTYSVQSGYDLTPGNGRAVREAPSLPSAAAAEEPLGMAGYAVVAGAALATGALLALALKFAILPFYTRLRRDRLLDNPVRARLFEAVRRDPGIRLEEVTDYLGVGRGAARHHVDKLVEAKLLMEVQQDRAVRYYVTGDVPPTLAKQEAVLRAGSNRRVYELLQAEPGLSLREAGERLGMSAPSVHKCVKKLREAGLLPQAGERMREA